MPKSKALSLISQGRCNNTKIIDKKRKQSNTEPRRADIAELAKSRRMSLWIKILIFKIHKWV